MYKFMETLVVKMHQGGAMRQGAANQEASASL